MRTRKQETGSVSFENVALLALVAVAGSAGFGVLGIAMDKDIGGGTVGHADAGTSPSASALAPSPGAAPLSAMAGIDDGETNRELNFDDVVGEDAEGDDYVGPQPEEVPPSDDDGIDTDNGSADDGSGDQGRSFTVQVIAFGRDKKAEAEAYAEHLRTERGFDAYVEETETGLWAVRVGHLGSAEEAEQVLRDFAEEGMTEDGFVTQTDGGRAGVIDGEGEIEEELIPEPVFERENTKPEPKAKRGFFGALASGLWNTVIGVGKEARDLWSGLVGTVKNVGVDFLLGDVVGGGLSWLAKVVTGGAVSKDTSWIPFYDAAQSLRNAWNKRDAALESFKHVYRQTTRCVSPGNGLGAEARGQSCGRAATLLASAVGSGFVVTTRFAAGTSRIVAGGGAAAGLEAATISAGAAVAEGAKAAGTKAAAEATKTGQTLSEGLVETVELAD